MARGLSLRVIAASAGAVVSLLAGCHSTAPGPRLATCGPLPVSNGRDAGQVEARLDLPGVAASGGTLHGQIVVSAAHPVSFVSGQPFEVLILRDGHVVGGGFYGVAVAGTGIGVEPKPGRPFHYPVSVVIRGCPASGDENSWPKNRPALPAGDYNVVAAVEDTPPANTGTGHLLTAPHALHVTAG